MNLDRLITETVRRQLLVEGAINNSWHQARKMVIAKFGYTKEEAEKMLDEICNQLSISHEMVKFIKGCTRMVLNGELNDQRVLGDFKDALNKIKDDGHIGEFDTNLRRFDQPKGAVNSAKDIINIFKQDIDRERDEHRKNLSGRTFELNPDYKIIKIDSFEEAQEYSRYTSWCVTSWRTNYNGYTNNGINQFYFCLQNGFENIENDGDFDDKKDAYALSMLAILVNPEGELIHCTNRKNNDQSTLNPMEISELLGCNFYETFKPSTMWCDALEDAKKQLANGENPKYIFEEVRELNNGLLIVRLLDRWGILKGGSFINETWYDDIWGYTDNFVRVYIEGKGYNFINGNGDEICNKWYDEAGLFSEGLAKVYIEDKGYNFINENGDEICDNWYLFIHDFHKGFAMVCYKRDGGCNFINREGKEICKKRYDEAGEFQEGFARVKDETKGYNFINHDGEELCDRWYYRATVFSEGFARVEDEAKGYNFINRNGKEICDRWYYFVANFHEGFAIVKDKTKGFNFINRDSKEICDRWYDEVDGFSEGFAGVYNKGKGWNFINRDGKEISDKRFDDIKSFYGGFAEVVYKGKLHLLRKDGVLCGFFTRQPIKMANTTDIAESLIDRIVMDVLT